MKQLFVMMFYAFSIFKLNLYSHSLFSIFIVGIVIGFLVYFVLSFYGFSVSEVVCLSVVNTVMALIAFFILSMLE